MKKEYQGEKYILLCPKCKSTFDTSEQMEMWKQEFLEEIDKIIKRMKEK